LLALVGFSCSSVCHDFFIYWNFGLIGFLRHSSIYLMWLLFAACLASIIRSSCPPRDPSLMNSESALSTNASLLIHNHVPVPPKPSSSTSLPGKDPCEGYPSRFPASMAFSTFSEALKFGVERNISSGFSTSRDSPVLSRQPPLSDSPS